MKRIAMLIVIGLIGSQIAAFAAQSDYDTEFATNTRTQPGYFQNMARDWARGMTNIVSSPLEIPITIMKHHKEDPSAPVVRESAGLVDGIVRTVTRAGSGVWDLVVSLFPGDQEGAPMKPETLFGSSSVSSS